MPDPCREYGFPLVGTNGNRCISRLTVCRGQPIVFIVSVGRDAGCAMVNKKKPPNVESLPMNRHTMLAVLRDLAKDSGKVFFSAHAEIQMHDRNVTRMQVMECIRQDGNRF